jgi:hypothetical protein
MHFINKKLATGLDPPQELLPEMVPPSLRPKPIVTEEAHASKEFEELQTQVTELQREKLFYEQRATENEMLTRQKRTELTNLELEMESVFKTLQEREMKRSEEQKRLSDYEERLAKVCYHHNLCGWKTKTLNLHYYIILLEIVMYLLNYYMVEMTSVFRMQFLISRA